MSRAPKPINPYSSWSSLFGATVRRLRLGMRAGRPLTQAELVEAMQSALEARDKANELYNQGREQATQYVQQGKDALGQYVDKGKEYYDKGRTQWSQYVDKGKDLVQSQTDAVTAAVNAGKQAYTQKSTDSPQTPQA